MPDGKLRSKTKETIALLISYGNECKYCSAALAAALRSLRFDEEKNAVMLQPVLQADLIEKK